MPTACDGRNLLAQPTRTALYGPVRTVVWQGSAGDRRPYANLTAYPETIPVQKSPEGKPGGSREPLTIRSPGTPFTDSFRVADHSDRTTVMAGYSSASPGAREEFGEVCCAIDSHVDRTFLIEVFLVSGAQKFLRARHHEQIPPKFSSNTRLTKGVLWPEKSIRSIKSSTVR